MSVEAQHNQQSEDIAAQQKLLATHRRTLAHLVEQAALHGGESLAPPVEVYQWCFHRLLYN